MSKRRFTTALSRYVVNPVVKLAVRLGLVRRWAILETRGRKNRPPAAEPGREWAPRRHVLDRRRARAQGRLCPEHCGRPARSRPRRRTLADGTAQALPDDDPLERQRSLPGFNARVVRLMGTELMTVRIDLAPE